MRNISIQTWIESDSKILREGKSGIIIHPVTKSLTDADRKLTHSEHNTFPNSHQIMLKEINFTSLK